jgi:hypothetical protein
MTEPQPEEIKGESERETEGERRRTNIMLLLFFVVLVGIGVWLVNALIDARNADDCIAQRRTNCTPIDVPSR